MLGSIPVRAPSGIAIVEKVYVRSINVDKIRSEVSARVVCSSRTKFSNAEPVDFRTVSTSEEFF